MTGNLLQSFQNMSVFKLVFSINEDFFLSKSYWTPQLWDCGFDWKPLFLFTQAKSWSSQKPKKNKQNDSTRYPNSCLIVARRDLFSLRPQVETLELWQMFCWMSFSLWHLHQTNERTEILEIAKKFHVIFRFSNIFVSVKTELMSPLKVSIEIFTFFKNDSIEKRWFRSLELRPDSPWNPKKFKKN